MKNLDYILDYKYRNYDLYYRDEKKYILTERELMKIFELLNKLNYDKSNEPVKQTKSTSTQTDNCEFSLNDSHKLFNSFIEKEQNEQSEIFNDTVIENFIENNNFSRWNFSGWNYSRCKTRFEELKIQYNKICDEMDFLVDFTSPEEAKIKQEYMELEEKLLNLM